MKSNRIKTSVATPQAMELTTSLPEGDNREDTKRKM
jgi:hypothetical protein